MTHARCINNSAANNHRRGDDEATNKETGDHEAAIIKHEASSKCQEKKLHHQQQQGPTSGSKPIGGQRGERNLDSGYAWIILLVMFLLASSTYGTNRVYGLIYARQVAVGYYDHEQASWPIATASTVENLAGLMTPALARFLTWRQIELLATLLFVLANVGAYFSDSLAVDILCLGVIQGLALSINTVLSLVINNDYFERYRTTAYGISLSGSTFGIIYLGPIVSWCLEREQEYGGFRSSYLAIGGVLALNALLVVFIKPRDKAAAPENSLGAQAAAAAGVGADNAAGGCGGGKTSVERKRSLLERHLERKSSVASIALMCKQMRQSDLQRKSIRAGDPAGLVVRQRPVAAEFAALKKSASSSEVIGGETVDNDSKQYQCHKLSLFSAPQSPERPRAAKDEAADFVRQCQANMMISAISNSHSGGGGGGDDDHGDRANGDPAANKKRTSQQSMASDSNQSSFSVSPELDQRRQRRQLLDSLNKPISNDINQAEKLTTTEAPAAAALDKRTDEGLSAQLVGALLRSPYLHCVWIMLSLYYLIARIFIIILVDLAKDNALSASESRSLLNYWSLGELVGRIVLCSFVDLNWLSVRVCVLLTCTSMSLCIALMALLGGSFYLYAVCSALVAALISLEYVLINVLMIEYLGRSRVTSCYSLGSLISSLVLLGRPALIGLFRDRLGSYNGLLLLLAGLSLAYGLLFGLVEPLLVRYWPKGQLMHRSQLSSSS